MSRLIMVSRWAASELWWLPDETWMRTYDERPLGRLTDAEVLGLFGDEAFQRRDVLVASNEQVFRPELAELIGRRVSEAVVEAGWAIGVDDSLAFAATHNAHRIEVTPQRMPNRLVVSAPCGAQVFTHMGRAEKYILEGALEGRPMSGLGEIMSWGIGDTEE